LTKAKRQDLGATAASLGSSRRSLQYRLNRPVNLLQNQVSSAASSLVRHKHNNMNSGQNSLAQSRNGGKAKSPPWWFFLATIVPLSTRQADLGAPFDLLDGKDSQLAWSV
jgi:hypothetical protein